MASHHNRTVAIVATKLGVGDEPQILSKAAEYGRLLDTKTLAGSNLSDTSKIIICLDLAAARYNGDFDSKTAVAHSGLRPSVYANYKKIIENLLDLNSQNLTTSTLCVTLQCTEIQSLADEILSKYQTQSKQIIDLTLPHYVCMAVYYAGRINKVKVSKSKLIEKSRLKPAQWAKVDAEWSKFINENFANRKKIKDSVKGVRQQHTLDNLENVPETTEGNLMQIDKMWNKDSEAKQIEPYEDWKRRMLEEAYKELNEQNELMKESPRKSPRKILKQNTVKDRGVRLLFSN